MSKKFNLIVNILIIALIVALVFVMMNYYAGTPSSIPTNTDVIGEDILPNNNEVIITNNQNQEKNENETIINIENSGEVKEDSGDIKEESGDTKIENQSTTKPNNDNMPKDEIPQKENPVIITSENETSSKEKREILTELDKTLMELLDVVEKVQTVDESRLIIDDSEVQE